VEGRAIASEASGVANSAEEASQNVTSIAGASEELSATGAWARRERFASICCKPTIAKWAMAS